jgi:hypothetical protein
MYEFKNDRMNNLAELKMKTVELASKWPNEEIC